MKKLLVSLMLVLGLVAFAAESAPSATVGYVKYTVGAGTNMIAVPMQDDFTMASTLHANFDTVRKWNTSTNSWDLTYKPFFGEWPNDFAIVAGEAYLVNSTAPTDFIVDDEVVVNPAYNIVTGTNTIMVPLTKSNMTMASDYFTETGTIDAIRKWNNSTNGWDLTYKPFFGEWPNDFAVGIGDPHLINSTGPVTWPSGKSGQYDENFAYDTKGAKGNEKLLLVGCVDELGNNITVTDSISYHAVLTVGTGPALGAVTEQRSLAGEQVTMLQYTATDFRACATIDMSLFTNWDLNNVVTTTVKNWVAGKAGYMEGTDVWVIDNNTSGNTYQGCSDFAGVGTAPVALATASSIGGNNMPLETKLEQNYPNPFNPTTTINFSLRSEGVVKLNVYNYTGQLVNSLVNGQMNAGYHTVNFDASNLSAGVYYYTLEADSKVMTNKMVLVK